MCVCTRVRVSARLFSARALTHGGTHIHTETHKQTHTHWGLGVLQLGLEEHRDMGSETHEHGVRNTRTSGQKHKKHKTFVGLG